MENSNNYISEENKKLLFIDLCTRLPYGVKILDIPADVVGCLFLVSTTDAVQYETNNGTGIQTLYGIKPYLRPLSNMTEKEKKELNNVLEFQYYSDDSHMCESTDWLNAHHFDYRGLIEKGLALEAPKEMYENTNL